MSYIDKLIANCLLAKEAVPIREFELKNISELDGMKQAIYIIEQIDEDIEKTFSNFSEYRKKEKRKCAKLNSPCKVMYVGSSTTDVKKRIKQHQGYGHPSTYALHLKYWFDGESKITIRQYDEAKEVLQIIEDDLSDRLKPAFGKQGGNNK